MATYRLTLRETYPITNPETYRVTAGSTVVLSDRQLAEARRKGVKVIQGHGIWEMVPFDLWTVDAPPMGD